MNIEKTGGPAFPLYCGPGDEHNAKGMTIRDYFAARVLEGLFACDSAILHEMPENVAKATYKMADAMLKERDK